MQELTSAPPPGACPASGTTNASAVLCEQDLSFGMVAVQISLIGGIRQPDALSLESLTSRCAGKMFELHSAGCSAASQSCQFGLPRRMNGPILTRGKNYAMANG